MISWAACFSEPYESAWCAAQKLAWLSASDAPDALSAVVGRMVRASPSPKVRNFNDLGWWKNLLDDSDAKASADGRVSAWRAVLAGGSEVVLGPGANALCAPALRVCPICIATGYHSVVHQLEGLLRCPIHGNPLVTGCSRCGDPLGPYTVLRQDGFHCDHCGASLLRGGNLAIPAKQVIADEGRAIAPLVEWVRRALPQIRPASPRNLVYGRWEGEHLLSVSWRVARLALLTQVEPCPLGADYFDPGVPELRVRVKGLQAKAAPIDAKSAVALATHTVAKVEHWLRGEVLRDHYACFACVGQYLWGDREQLAMRPQLCRLAYAFGLWKARTTSWLGWIRDIERENNSVVAIDRRSLLRRLVSAYFFALNGIELMSEMCIHGNRDACDAALESGCLEREYDPWLQLTQDNERVWRMGDCNVLFGRRIAAQEPFCDHGEMMGSIWRGFEKFRAAKRT